MRVTAKVRGNHQQGHKEKRTSLLIRCTEEELW